MSSVLFAECEVYHGRHDGIANKFTYHTFNVAFRTDQENELVSLLKSKSWGLLSFKGKDYLDQRDATLDSEIKRFLRERLNYEAEEVWLYTMPRVFGFAFNPVSFWLCKKNGQVDGVLVEVNNTFQECHYYWLKPPQMTAQKVFHVSPFMPVEGEYKFRFQFSPEKFRVDINYFGSDQKLRLSTWIQGDLRPLEEVPVFSALLRFGWMTVLVVARIHFQALRLWWKGAQFYKKPLPPENELT